MDENSSHEEGVTTDSEASSEVAVTTTVPGRSSGETHAEGQGQDSTEGSALMLGVRKAVGMLADFLPVEVLRTVCDFLRPQLPSPITAGDELPFCADKYARMLTTYARWKKQRRLMAERSVASNLSSSSSQESTRDQPQQHNMGGPHIPQAFQNVMVDFTSDVILGMTERQEQEEENVTWIPTLATGRLKLTLQDPWQAQLLIAVDIGSPLLPQVMQYLDDQETATQVRFNANGERIAAGATAETIGLEDGDVVEILFEQTGGGGDQDEEKDSGSARPRSPSRPPSERPRPPWQKVLEKRKGKELLVPKAKAIKKGVMEMIEAEASAVVAENALALTAAAEEEPEIPKKATDSEGYPEDYPTRLTPWQWMKHADKFKELPPPKLGYVWSVSRMYLHKINQKDWLKEVPWNYIYQTRIVDGEIECLKEEPKLVSTSSKTSAESTAASSAAIAAAGSGTPGGGELALVKDKKALGPKTNTAGKGIIEKRSQISQLKRTLGWSNQSFLDKFRSHILQTGENWSFCKACTSPCSNGDRKHAVRCLETQLEYLKEQQVQEQERKDEEAIAATAEEKKETKTKKKKKEKTKKKKKGKGKKSKGKKKKKASTTSSSSSDTDTSTSSSS